MDLLEIRKKAKEQKEASGKAAEAELAAGSPETAGTASAPDEPPVETKPPVRKQARRDRAGKGGVKKKAAPKQEAQETAAAHEPVPESAPVSAEHFVPVPEPDTAPVTQEAVPYFTEIPETAGDGDGRDYGFSGGYDDGDGPVGNEELVEYLAFMLSGEEYAVRVEDIKEIIRLQVITNVPRAPEFVEGIISLRGVIIPVFNIRKRLGLPDAGQTRTTRILVVSDAGFPQGIIVDKVTGVAKLRADGIEPPPAVIGGVEAEYLEGVGRIGERLLILFNTHKVLSMEG